MHRTVLPIACGSLAILLATACVLAITNGEVDSDNEFANVGAIVLIHDLPDFPEFSPAPFAITTGTLIHPRVMLTAGHSVDNIEQAMAAGAGTLADLRVSFSSNAYEAGSWIEIAAVLKHPDYNPRFTSVGGASEGAHDIGVVILKTAAAGVPVAALPAASLLDQLREAGALRDIGGGRAVFLVVGFGKTSGDGPAPDGLRRVTTGGFQALRDEWLFLSQNPTLGYGGGADHDSGGPVFWVDPTGGGRSLVALISAGDQKTRAFGVDYRVDTRDSLDFIDSVLTAVEDGDY